MEMDDLSDLKIERKEKRANQPPPRMQRFVEMALIFSAAVIVIVIAWLVFRPAEPVSVTSVSRFYPSQTITVLNASGYVVAQRKAAVASKVTGRLDAISVEEGSRIKKGEVIARLEGEDLKAQRAQAVANLAAAKYNFKQAQAELEDARTNSERAGALVKNGYISRSEYDTAETRFAKARAALSSSEATVKSFEAALDAAAVNLEYTLIRAPFDAVVLTKSADVGDIVTPIGAAANAKSAVVTIADMDSLEVEVDVSESNLSKVRIEQPSEIQLDAIPDQRFAGTVHTIVPTADRNKASVMVKVRFLVKDRRILPEMSAKVAFLSRPLNAKEETARTAISKNAVTVRGGSQVAFIVKGDRVEAVPIKTGEAFGDVLEVLQGLKPGDKAVVNPPEKLKAGEKIRIVEK
jgi:RND family efflux transporter MFP subunit